MATLPFGALLLGAGVTWFFRRRADRVTWGIATAFALLTWLASLGLSAAVPASLGVSVWAPADLFGARIILTLDRSGWQLTYALATLLLAVLLTSVGRPGGGSGLARAGMLAYAAIGVLGLLAGNLLTVATIWALLDTVTFVFLLSRVEDAPTARQLAVRLGVDLTGVILVVASAIVGMFPARGAPADTAGLSPFSVGLMVLAVLLRLGLLPLHFALPNLPQVRRGQGTLLRLVPAAVALSVFARQLSGGIPVEVVPWLRIGGLLGLIVGGVRWLGEEDPVKARPFLVMGIASMGALAASVSPESAGDIFLATGSLLLLVGSVVSLNEIHAPTHRIWPAAMAFVLAGAPWTLGSTLAGRLFPQTWSLGAGVSAFVGCLVTAMLAVGLLRQATVKTEPWQAGESLVKLVYGLGLALPVFVAIGLGLESAPEGRLQAFAVWGAVIFAGLILWAWVRGGAGTQIARLRRDTGWLDPEPIYFILWRAYDVGIGIVRGIGSALEGEGAVLWLLVVLVVAAAATSSGIH
jgi:hypothetical protein